VFCRYWELKKAMASGSEPPYITALLQRLQKYCVGQSLCGAGGGGYAVLILRREYCVEDIKDAVRSLKGEAVFTNLVLSVHGGEVNVEGISLNVCDVMDLEKLFESHIIQVSS
jgi:fucokinase